MNQVLAHVRAVLAALAFGVVLALGLASANAGQPSPGVDFAGIQHHRAVDFSPDLTLACQELHCQAAAADCCVAAPGSACCGFGAMALGGMPDAVDVHAPRAAWLTLPVVSLADAASSVGRRPPRI